jgi:hypothetical protein
MQVHLFTSTSTSYMYVSVESDCARTPLTASPAGYGGTGARGAGLASREALERGASL